MTDDHEVAWASVRLDWGEKAIFRTIILDESSIEEWSPGSGGEDSMQSAGSFDQESSPGSGGEDSAVFLKESGREGWKEGSGA